MKTLLTDNEMNELKEAKNRYEANSAIRNIMYMAIESMSSNENKYIPNLHNSYPELFRVIESKIGDLIKDFEKKLIDDAASIIEDVIRKDEESPIIPKELRKEEPDSPGLNTVHRTVYLNEKFADKDIDHIIKNVTATLFSKLEIDARYNEYDSMEQIEQMLSNLLRNSSMLLDTIKDGEFSIMNMYYTNLITDTTARTGSELAALDIIWTIFDMPEELVDTIIMSKANIIGNRIERQAMNDKFFSEEQFNQMMNDIASEQQETEELVGFEEDEELEQDASNVVLFPEK